MITMRKIKNLYHYLEALLAVIFYGYPARKMTVIGVTGTDGKTTTASIIFHLLQNAGEKAGLISTIGAKINSEKIDIGPHTTTPSAFLIQKLLKKMSGEKCKYAVIEVTSHAIDQNRIIGANIQIGVLTNITPEHLDYHDNLDNYLKTKAIFLKKCPISIINRDDASYEKIKKIFENKKFISYGIDNKADVKGEIISTNKEETVFRAKGNANDKIINLQILTSLPGIYNIYNLLAAVSVCKILNLPDEKLTSGIKNFIPIIGRMEIVIEKPFKVIVDFAHTPNAFKEVLRTVKSLTRGKVIHVFGATGKRDKTKRPIMGEISGNLVDYVILTSEDTYGEDPNNIIFEIEEGIKKTSKKEGETYWKIPSREEAIKKALSLAGEDDLVILTGVGHQNSLNLGDRELPWSDSKKVKELIDAC